MAEPERCPPEFQRWLRAPSEYEYCDLVRDRPRAAAFAFDFICWLHDEANQVLSIAPTCLPASTTCPSQPSPAPEIVEPKQRKKSGGGGRAVKALFGDDDFPALGPSGALAAAAFANAPISAPAGASAFASASGAFGNASGAFASPEKGAMMRQAGTWGPKAGQQAVATGLRPSPHTAKAEKGQKAKRRIRPTLLNETSMADGSGGHGDLTRMQSEAPIERPDRSAVATVVVGAGESPYKTPVKGAAPSPFTRPLSAGPSTEKKKKRGLPTAPPPLLLCSPPSCKPPASLSIATAPPPDTERLTTVARTYAMLLQERLVPKLSREIHLLLRMIMVDEGACIPPKYPNLEALSIDEEPKAQDAVDLAPPPPLLCTGLACHIFANVVLEHLRPLLLSLGPCLLTRLSSRLPMPLSLPPSVPSAPPPPCQSLPLIVEEAKKEAEQAWDRAAEKAAALLGQQQAIATMGRGSSADGGSGYALPFQQDRDARHAYQACQWSRDLYNRQEGTRDAFLQLLRDFQAEKSQLDNHRVSRFLDTLPQRSARVLDLLQPGPSAASSLSCSSTWGPSSAAMAWFARFFTDTLVQMGLTAAQETDEDVLRTLKSRGGSWNAQKVQQLQGRLRTRSQPASTTGATSNRQRGPARADVGAGEPHRKRGGAGGVQRQTSASSTSSNTAGPSPRIPSPEDSFTGNQEFFFRFLRACNNHALNSMLAQHLAACLSQSVMAGEEERVDDLVTRTARLKIMARFLGVLAFGPYWMPPEALQAYERVEVLQRQLHDTIRALDLQLAPCPSPSSSSSGPLPTLPLLDKAWVDGRAVLTLPWLSAYLSMMRWDLASPRTRYYTAVFARLRSMLQRLYAALLAAAQGGQGTASGAQGGSASSPSSPACAWSTALYLILEVEQLFDELGVDPAGPCDDKGLVPFGRGLDSTPLLLSEAFVSRCCPPLSDLLHLVSASPSSVGSLRSRSGSVTSAAGDVPSSTPIKKVRPYTISTSTTARIQPTTRPATLATSSSSGGSSEQLLQRLESCFFSQHPHVHRSAELVLQASLRNASVLALTACCDPLAEKTLADLFPSASSLPVEDPSVLADKLALAEESLASETRGFLRKLYPERIPAALELLVRPAADPAVAQMAGSLTVQHALKDGIEPVVREVCETFRQRIDTHRHALLRKARVKLSAQPTLAMSESGKAQRQASASGGGGEAGAGVDGAAGCGGKAGEDLYKVKEEMADLARLPHPCDQTLSGLLCRAEAAMRALAADESELDANVIMYACTDIGLDACRARKQWGNVRAGNENPPTVDPTEQEAVGSERGAAWVGFWEALAALACHLGSGLMGGQLDEWAKEKVAMPLRRLIREEDAVECLFYILRGGRRRDDGGLACNTFRHWWLGLLTAGVVTPLQIEDALVRLLRYGDRDRMDACREVLIAYRSQIADSGKRQRSETSDIVAFCHLDALLEIMQ